VKIFSIPACSNFPYSEIRHYSYDLLELRLDYSENPLVFPTRLESFLSIDSTTIVTIRDLSEGGVKSIPFEQKLASYLELIKRTNCLVDCEFELFIKHNPPIPHENLILSKHFSEECSNLSETVSETIDKANKFNVRYLKLIIPVETYQQMQNFSNWKKASKTPLIILGSGLLGKLSRILWKLNGSVGTYLALENFKTSPDQLTFEEYELYGCELLDERTILGGIIGDKHVYNSLGLLYYNRKLRRIDSRIAYLPFPVKDLQDFVSWLRYMNQQIIFYGFSVTMPFKSLFSQYFFTTEQKSDHHLSSGQEHPSKSDSYQQQKIKQSSQTSDILTSLAQTNDLTSKIANLFSVKVDTNHQLEDILPEQFLNTDLDAFRESIKILNVDKDDLILVFGAGATACTFLREFTNFANLKISSRNEEKGIALAKLCKIRYLSLKEIADVTFDLVVNCTPLGMVGEDFFSVTGITMPKKFLDLTYTKQKTKAINRCIEKKIPCVDGQKFWLLQARRQEEMFRRNISKLL